LAAEGYTDLARYKLLFCRNYALMKE